MTRNYSTKFISVVGTDTGVGKTSAARTISDHLSILGYSVRAVNPYVSGSTFGKWEDCDLLDPLRKYRTPARYCLPLSPYGAVRKGEKLTEKKKIFNYIAKASIKVDWLVIEGIGGVMVPLEKKYLWLDFHEKYRWPAVIVGRGRLGTLNHTLLTITALKSREIPILGFILCNTDDYSFEETKENAEIIKEISSVEALGMIEYNASDWKKAWLRGINWKRMEKYFEASRY